MESAAAAEQVDIVINDAQMAAAAARFLVNAPGLGAPADVPVNGARAEALLKAGLAHLWFVTLHPFEDGNGRIARVIEIGRASCRERV